MAKDREKFLKRQDRRKRAMIATIIQDILSNDIDKYDCIAMEWMDNHRRIRYDTIRIIFTKTPNNQIIIKKIWFRWDVYK